MDGTTNTLPYGSQHYIDGKFVSGSSDLSGPVFNPASGKEIYQSAYADEATISEADLGGYISSRFPCWASRSRPVSQGLQQYAGSSDHGRDCRSVGSG